MGYDTAAATLITTLKKGRRSATSACSSTATAVQQLMPAGYSSAVQEEQLQKQQSRTTTGQSEHVKRELLVQPRRCEETFSLHCSAVKVADNRQVGPRVCYDTRINAASQDPDGNLAAGK
jgi:hypothetical protein